MEKLTNNNYLNLAKDSLDVRAGDNELRLSRLGGHSAPNASFVPQVLIHNDNQNELSRSGKDAGNDDNGNYINIMNDSRGNDNKMEVIEDNYGNVNDFSLQEIIDVYSSFENGSDVYFLDSEGNRVKVESIEKVPYSGKIYDVDVGNDIVLVRRASESGISLDNATAFWSGNSNNGTCGGTTCPTFSSGGKFGGAGVFDGTSDYVTVASAVTFANLSASVSVWFNTNDVSQEQRIYSRGSGPGNNPSIQITGGAVRGIIGAPLDGGGVQVVGNSTSISSDTWYYATLVFNGTNILMYLNGTLVTNDLAVTGIGTTAQRSYIGARYNTNSITSFFNGTMDEVILFNRSLPAEEIALLYNASVNKYQTNMTALAEGAHRYTGYVVDESGNKNNTAERTLTLDTTGPVITIVYPDNSTTHFSAIIDINASLSDALQNVVYCGYSLDGAANVTMTAYNSSFYTYAHNGIAHGYHNVSVYCNDTLDNWNSATESNFYVNLADLTIANVTLPNPLYPNSTFIVVNVSNIGPPAVTDVNVTCKMDGSVFGSQLISSLGGTTSLLTNCTYDFRSGNYTLNVSVDIANSIPEANESNNNFVQTANAVIDFENQSSIGVITGLGTVNHNESVRINVTIPAGTINNSKVGYNVSSVWAKITIPDGTTSNVSFSGRGDGGLWNGTYTSPGTMGTYTIRYYANLTNRFGFVEITSGNFSIKNTSIIINAIARANTTDTISVSGAIRMFNGSSYENLASNRFNIKLNGVAVSSNSYVDINFSRGNSTNVNSTTTARLNLSSLGNEVLYSDDYSTTRYLTDSFNRTNEGYSTSIQGHLFELDVMTQAIGNVTYQYASPTTFYNASVSVLTMSSSDGGGNTSILYSYDNANWVNLNWTTTQGALIKAEVPVTGKNMFYVMLKSNTNGLAGENPVVGYNISHRSYQYSMSGNVISEPIHLPNVTYTVLKWDRNLSAYGTIKVQIRESNDAATWGAWSDNYTNYADNSITSYSQSYVQYKALLETTNTSYSPVLYNVSIMYFNASTDATGNYTYNITIPTDSLGVLPLQVRVESSPQGLSGQNTTNLEVWARTSVPYATVVDYTTSVSQYSVYSNFTRTDTSANVNGTIVILLYGNSFSSSRTCSAVTTCSKTWNIPVDFGFGNYTVNITGVNESGYYINSSASYNVFIEERNTTGNIVVGNKTITDFSVGQAYHFLWNATINNTGGASMLSPYVFDSVAARSAGVQSISVLSGCGRGYPNATCIVTMNITMSGSANVGGGNPHFISWRANWTDNDGALSGGATNGYITYTNMYIIIEGNSSMSVTNSSVNLSMQHGTNQSFVFSVTSSGSSALTGVNISFDSYGIPVSWVNITPSYISQINAGESTVVTVNVSLPLQTSSGNYSGIINVTSGNDGALGLNLTVRVASNVSWRFTPAANMTYNVSFGLSTAGIVGNLTLINLGNENMTFAVAYTPWGGVLYNDFGTTLFEENSTVGSSVMNPLIVNVTKGQNTTMSIYQKGRSGPLTKVGIIVEVSNSTGSPLNQSTWMTFDVVEEAPKFDKFLFIVDGNGTTTAEVNKNVTIKIVTSDDVNINPANYSWINVTTPSSSVVYLNATNNTEFVLNGIYYIGVNYTINYTPTSAGTYSVRARIVDAANNFNSSSVYNFTAYGTTSLAFNANTSAATAANIDRTHGFGFSVNYNASNPGVVYAYNLSLTFAKNDSINIVPGNYNYGDLSPGNLTNKTFRINATNFLIAGSYDIQGTLSYRNPDNTQDTITRTLTLTVSANKTLGFAPSSLAIVVPSGSTNSTNLLINNTGNSVLEGMSFSCTSGDACNSFTFTFNDTAFSVPWNASKTVIVNATSPSGFAAGNYNGTITLTEQSISQMINVSITVPQTLGWTATPLAINATKAASQVGQLEAIKVVNTGNVNLTFSLVGNSTIAVPNMTSISVPLSNNASFMVNYSAPSTDGVFRSLIMISNESATPTQLNVSVNLTTTNLNASLVLPRTGAALSNVSSGQLLSILTNSSFQSAVVTSNSTWAISIGGSTCANVSSSYSSTNVYWNISCNAPTLTDGTSYDLAVTLTHDSYGEVSVTESSAVTYRDSSPPLFNLIQRNNINMGASINLYANISDSVGVDSAWAYVTYPNGTIYNASLSLSGGFYTFTSLLLQFPGEYVVNYSANDTIGNVNTTIDWFEVLDRYTWKTFMKDYQNSPATVNVTLLRPSTLTELLNNQSVSTGEFSFLVNKRYYDIKAVLSGDYLIVRNVNFSNTSTFTFNVHRVENDQLSETVALHEVFDGIASNSSNLSDYAVTAVFNYTGLSYDNSAKLEVIKCASWNFTARSCLGSWSTLASSVDRTAKTVEGNSTGFSAYFLAENKCGNGLCETSYTETTDSCAVDCPASVYSTATSSSSSSGGGGGGGGSSRLKPEDLAKIESLIKSYIEVGGIKVETTSVYKELFAGDTTTFRIKLANLLNLESTINLEATGDVAPLITFESTSVKLAPSEIRDILVRVTAPKFAKPGNYDGDLKLSSGEKSATIPVTIHIISPEGKLLDVKIQPLTPTVAPGGTLRLQTDLLNLGKTKKVDVQFDLQLLDIETGELYARSEEAFAVETTMSVIKEFKIPLTVKEGKYIIKGTAAYSSLEDTQQVASSIAYVVVQYPFWQRKLFNIPVWVFLIVLGGLGLGVGGFFYARYLDYKRRRFKTKVEFNKLPQPGANAAFVGKIAETGMRAFMDLNKLQMHTLVAGATGGGKTIAAQDIVEAALLHKKSVIVFDPTAQWSGFLRKCEDKTMLKRYKFFDMNLREAKPFNGVVKTIRDPYEVIDIKKYLNRPGEVIIFNISHLTPSQMDILVASTIEQVFKSEPEESPELKTLIVYDEVHRLLPKFGGTGQGFVQLERGAREFRKWGIGLLLISQVLSDFVGEIKANIGTEVQMGTRYEGDLERINLKYGEDLLKSVVKEPIGTGMIVNAEYNSGRPYFVSFRPLLHSTKRLSNEELKNYEKYFDEIEDIEFQIEQFKKAEVDVLDLELELKLCKDKVKEGQFQMADMYLETLRPAIEAQWKKIGKKPQHLAKEKINKEEVKKAISIAEKERAKYIKKNPEVALSFDEMLKEVKAKIEAKKKAGKNTANIELKFSDLQGRLKNFKGKLSGKDKEEVKQEIEKFEKEADKI